MKIRPNHINRYWRRSAVCAAVLLGGASLCIADVIGRNLTETEARAYIQRAERMLTEGNPEGAADQLRPLDHTSLPVDMETTASALKAEAACRLALPSAGIMAETFLKEHPDSERMPYVLLALGNLRFNQGDYNSARECYSEIRKSALPSAERDRMLVSLTVSTLRCGLIEESRELIKELAVREGMRETALFYDAYADYIDKNYRSAYPKFEKVPSSFRPGYYLAQMDYADGNYDKALSRALPLLKGDMDPEMTPELRRIAGLSYFKKGNNEKARPLLEAYCSNPDFSPAKDALYALGSIEYSLGDMDKAYGLLEQVTSERNETGQGARLLMGQIAAARGDDSEAAIAFENAATKSFDTGIEEQALYNLIVARLKGGTVPFADNISLLETYLGSFPDSEHSEEIRKNLATAYFQAKDYSSALESINRIRYETPEVRRAKQKILYELGMSEEANNRHEEARRHLSEAARMTDADGGIAAEASLWEGNALYALGKFKEAKTAFTKAESSLRGENRTLATYNKAYSMLMAGAYREALRSFSSLRSHGASGLGTDIDNDIAMRVADCRYYTGDYRGAEKDYAALLTKGGETSDYASFRHAVVRGLRGDTEGKIQELKSLASAGKGNRWLPEILLELEQTLSSLDRVREAQTVLSQMATLCPGSRQTRHATLDMALALSRTGDTEKSMEAYRKVISSWPESEEARIADGDLRKLAASSGSLQEYSDFISGIPGFNAPDRQETETLLFEAAESAFTDNPTDTRRLREYVERYPDGRYLSTALFDLASSSESAGRHTKALEYLQTLLSKRGASTEAPEGMLMKGRIIERHFPNRNREALETYRALEKDGGPDFSADAWGGIMRTTSSREERLEYARKLQTLGGIDADLRLEARLFEGVGLLETRQASTGEKILSELASVPSTEAGSRSAVELGEYYLKKGELQKGKKLLEKFTDTGTPHQYWLARGFITLSDIYRAQGKRALADDYLRALQDNYPGAEPDIINAINSRLK